MRKSIIPLVFLMTSCGIASQGQECSSKFTSLQNHSIVTTNPVTVSGTAKKPVDAHVWVLAQAKGFNGWYPQGGGERMLENGNWMSLVYLGTAGQTGYFDIAIAVVNDQTNQMLNGWVSAAAEKGYPPIPFPDNLESCPLSMISVERR
jgi:hypothetical protein